MFTEGVRRFIIGLAKKVLIANPLSLVVEKVAICDQALLSPGIAWTGIAAFTLQIFFDFSGYTDMAIGVGKMLGFNLPENFNYPYISRSITDFWRRWHISLSMWLRDYLFMPMSLGMRRIGKTGAFLAMFITFAVCGIWHGPGWNFLIWGSIQGLFLGIELLFLAKILARLKIFAIFYTLMVVMTGFVFVMTTDLNIALQYIESMFSWNKISPFSPAELLSADQSLIMVIAALLCIPFRFSYKTKSQILLKTGGLAYIVFLLVIFILSIMALTSETHNPFIYFRF